MTSHSKIVRFNWECIAPFSFSETLAPINRNTQSDAPKSAPFIHPILVTSATFSLTSLPLCKTLHPWYLRAHHDNKKLQYVRSTGKRISTLRYFTEATSWHKKIHRTLSSCEFRYLTSRIVLKQSRYTVTSGAKPEDPQLNTFRILPGKIINTITKFPSGNFPTYFLDVWMNFSSHAFGSTQSTWGGGTSCEHTRNWIPTTTQ